MPNQEVVLRIVVDQGSSQVIQGAATVTPRIRSFRAGEPVFQADDSATSFFVVSSGVIRMFRKYVPFGDKSISRLAREGDIFGESGLISEPRDFTAEAMEDSVVEEYDTEEYVRAMRSQPDLAIAMVKALARKIWALDGEKKAPKKSMFNKLAAEILAMAEKDGEKAPGGILIPTKVTHEILAGLIGARRETVTVHLAKLRKLKAIEQRDTGLFVQPDNLRKVLQA